MEEWHLALIRAERDRVERQLDGGYLRHLHDILRLKLARLNAYIAAFQASAIAHSSEQYTAGPR